LRKAALKDKGTFLTLKRKETSNRGKKGKGKSGERRRFTPGNTTTKVYHLKLGGGKRETRDADAVNLTKELN